MRLIVRAGCAGVAKNICAYIDVSGLAFQHLYASALLAN